MEKNPDFDFPEEISLSEMVGARDNTVSADRALPKSTSHGKKVSGRMCTIITVSLFTTLVVLAFVGVIAAVVFRPTASESKTDVAGSSEQVTKIEEDMKNLRQRFEDQAQNYAANVSLLKIEIIQKHDQQLQEMQSQTDLKVNELQNQLNESKLTVSKRLHDQLNSSKDKLQQQLNVSVYELQNLLLNSTDKIQQQLELIQVNISAKISSFTQLHQQNYLDCKETQRNVSQQIQLQASKCTEGIHSLQMQTNHSNSEIEALAANLTQITSDIDRQIFELKATLNTTTDANQMAISCEELLPPTNGGVSVRTGSNLLANGLGSMATYYCNHGYALVGEGSRTCQDTNGGTVTTGTWSREQSTCQDIQCELLTPNNGRVTVNDPNLSVCTIATYSCDEGYVLVGDTVRTCEENPTHHGTEGTWNGTQPRCEVIVRCPSLNYHANGGVDISIGSYGVTLGVGAMATYTCNHGYGLVGQATRTCVNSGNTGVWSGSIPTCELILCPNLSSPENGNVVINSTVLSVGTTASYTCNQDAILVGDVIRTCAESSSGGISSMTGIDSLCAVPNRAMIDCQSTACRYETLVCPEHDNCSVSCYDSRQYACFQTDLFCPSGRGDCTLDCNNTYTCLQANTTCSQGDCIVNCESDYILA